MVFSVDSTQYDYCMYVCVQYQKPEELLKFEQTVRAELSNVKSSGDGDIQMCNPSWLHLLPMINIVYFFGFVSAMWIIAM